MKRTISLVTTLSLAGMVITSCSSLNKMKKNSDDLNYSITPEVLEKKGDMVDVKIDVTIPQNYFNKNVTVVATPVLKYDGGEVAFESKTLQGENVQGNNTVVPYESGKKISYTGQVAYEDAMKVSGLYVKFDASNEKKSVNFESDKLADGVIVTASLLQCNPTVADGGNKFLRNSTEQREASLYYLINSAEVRNSELKSEEMKNLEAFLKDVKASENVQIKNIEIQSYASPDGEYGLNERLAGNREKSSEKNVKNSLKKNKMNDYASNAELFKKYVVAEDWEGFRAALEASNIQDKELILRVLSMYSDPETREREIKNIASAYTAVADELLPKLRRSKYVINTERIGHTDEEIQALAKSDAAKLNVEELLYAATLTDNNADKLAIYEAVKANYPNDWRGYNDAATILFEMGKIAEAKENFEKAKSINSDNKVVANNLAAIAIMEGNYNDAEVLLGTATGSCDEVNHNKGIVAIKKGDYKAAVEYFGAENSVNAALANILAGNNSEASKKLQACGESTALVSYLDAIIAARNNDEIKAMASLKDACSKDASWKAYAKTDVEFAKYFSSSDFKSIVK